MADAKKCDRCGNFYKKDDALIRIDGTDYPSSVRVGSSGNWDYTIVDLCPACCTKFENFLKMELL